MISLKVDNPDQITFVASTQDEMSFLKENHEKVLDKFVELWFNNIGHLSIKTWKDYIHFCKQSPRKKLEMVEGHPIPILGFEELEEKSSFFCYAKATENLKFNAETMYRLESLANTMYSEYKK